MKKNVLFVLPTLSVGGAERSMLELIEYFKNDYNIELLVLVKKGGFLNKVPKNIKVFYAFEPKGKINNLLKKGLYFSLNYTTLYYKYIRKYKLKKEYDVEISFLEPNAPYFIATSGSKTHTIHSIRCSIDNPVTNSMNKQFFRMCAKAFNKIDDIYTVSGDATKEFKERYKKIKDKVITIDNIFDFEEIKNKAKESVDLKYDENCINVLTVGRFGEQKNYINLIEAHNKLIKKGLKYKLYFIGDYTDNKNYNAYGKKVLDLIDQYNLKDTIVLHGELLNPFPYIKNCDIYISTSNFEGFPRTITEALILNKPVIATNVSGTAYALGYGKYGLLVENNVEEIAEGLELLITNKTKREELEKKSKLFKDKKEESLRQIKGLIDREK